MYNVHKQNIYQLNKLHDTCMLTETSELNGSKVKVKVNLDLYSASVWGVDHTVLPQTIHTSVLLRMYRSWLIYIHSLADKVPPRTYVWRLVQPRKDPVFCNSTAKTIWLTRSWFLQQYTLWRITFSDYHTA